MPTETDLPCPDCDGDLAELVVDVGSLPGPRVENETASVAVCSNCRARFFPERTLRQLFPAGRGSTSGGV